MELTSLLVKERTITAEYPDPDMKGFSVDIAYIAREELQNIRKKCLTTKFNKRTRQPEEIVDDKLFLKLYVEKIIRGWKGLKMSFLEDLLPVDISKVKPEDELEYTPENALALMENSIAFDSWITGLVSDITAFNKNS